MFLQAVSDDSVSQKGERRLYMAGYLTYADQWTAFADSWAHELAASPSILYLKMAEAQNLRDQFRGWSPRQRDQKLADLAAVIKRFHLTSFDVSISTKDFYDFVKPNAPYGLATPYFPCLLGVVSLISRMLNDRGPRHPVDFVFDEQSGVSGDFQIFFQSMIKDLPRGARKLIKGNPVFRDDKAYLPLQAADMLAWHIRREHDDGRPQFGHPMAELLRGKDHVVMNIPRESMEAWGKFFESQNGINLIKTKSQWARFRAGHRSQIDAGYIPPKGTRLKNLIWRLRQSIVQYIRR